MAAQRLHRTALLLSYKVHRFNGSAGSTPPVADRPSGSFLFLPDLKTCRVAHAARRETWPWRTAEARSVIKISKRKEVNNIDRQINLDFGLLCEWLFYCFP
jgi:hypothetical protein